MVSVPYHFNIYDRAIWHHKGLLFKIPEDQIYFLKRSGFTSYLIRKDRDPQDAIKSLDDFTEPYQGAFDILDPVWKRIKR